MKYVAAAGLIAFGFFAGCYSAGRDYRLAEALAVNECGPFGVAYFQVSTHAPMCMGGSMRAHPKGVK